MYLTRTTVRIEPGLKKAIQAKALELNINFQTLFNQALRTYLDQLAQHKAEKLVFKSRDLGIPLNNLSREDIYAD